MQCSQYRESIQELVDGTLGPIRRAELERHLEECADCRTLAADLRVIRDTAASLDALEPPDGVWLQIAGRLRQEGRVADPAVPAPRATTRHVALLAIAAALILAVGASVLVLVPRFRENTAASRMGTPAESGPAAGESNPAREVAVESVEEEFRLAERHYQNAISKLEEAARLDQPSDNSGTLDAQTAAVLQKNLQVIDQAIAESRAALRAEPQSAPARDSLFDALRRKVALLQDTIALMNEMRKGNSAGAAQILNKS